LACLLYVMDLTVLHLAVPTLSAQLQPTSAQLLWIVDIYGYMVAGFLITMGTLGDRIGRRRLLLISETAAELGGALGLSILGSIGVAVYRADLATLPAAVRAQAAAAIRDTLGAAVAVADQFPHGLQAQVLAAARDAFIDGVQVTAAVAAAIAVAIAALAAVTFRRRHTTPTVNVDVPPTPATETDSPGPEHEVSRCAP
jgi:MFS family permease